MIELVYYPPYHSKYNRIERCWGVLEQLWNGTQLSTLEIAFAWAKSMTWNGISPIVDVVTKVYAKGIRLTKSVFARLASYLHRTEGIERWSVRIEPRQTVRLI